MELISRISLVAQNKLHLRFEMKRYASLRTTFLCLIVSITALMSISCAVSLLADYLYSDRNLIFQNSPFDQEDSDSSEDNESSDDDYSVLFETGLALFSPTDQQQSFEIDIHSYLEHHLEITAPPPKL